MGYSIKPTINCNGECGSCYENALRSKAAQIPDPDNIYNKITEIIREQIDIKDAGGEICQPPTFHGGEPLLLKLPDLERLAHKIHAFWGRNGIQTNGTLIDDRHIALFRKYKFHVGISIDGDLASTNRGRWNAKNRDDEYIQIRTDFVLDNMKKLHEVTEIIC